MTELDVPLRDWTLSASDVDAPVLLPAHLDAALASHPATYVLTRHVELPPEARGQPLTLVFPAFAARAMLRAGGLEATPLESAMRSGYRGSDQHAYRIPAAATAGGGVDLELTVDYKNLRNGWIDVPPRLGLHPEGDSAYRAVRAFDQVTSLTCLVVVLLTAFSFAVIWVRDRRRASYGWFALQSLIGGGSYALLMSGVSQHLFGPWENAALTPAISFGVITSVRFTRAQFDLRSPHWGWTAGFVASAVAACVFASPFLAPRYAVPTCIAMMLANVAYQVPVTARVWLKRGRRVDAAVVCVSWALLAGLAYADVAAWLGSGEPWGGLRAGCLGLMLVAVLQSMVLSLEHDVALRRAELLNVELRRQIADRADAIAIALARASGPEVARRALAPGDLVEGRYRVVRRVGEGAGGEVYEVVRREGEERLALKLLHSAADATEMARFVREAQIIAQLDHPHVVRIADVDVASDGRFFIAFEFVDGLSLRHHTRRWGDCGWALEVLCQIAGALEVIHERGIVHRDLKPANVLLVSNEGSAPRVKIADFGISAAAPRAFSTDAETRSATGLVPSSHSTLESRQDAATIGAGSGPSPASAPPAGPSAPASSTTRSPASANVGSAPASASVGSAPASASVGSAPAAASVGSAPAASASARFASASSMSAALSSGPRMLLTQTGVWMGTPKYMAPELAEGSKDAQPTCDVFAFGVMAYELLGDIEPFRESPLTTRLRGEPFERPRPLVASPPLPLFLAELLERCLAETPTDRPTAAELAAALGPAIQKTP